ncbi:Fic family protein [Spiroplasma sp. SV19]|uniref:Fic family protein n=1 Tax=Spiroplasma sp. SV19 TaxID=2570468 RepID=UPI0024B67D32|nr:Fic family protein [Spiroplasma sp. SV19]WHQ36712.1 hypothetical protein E7Y35_02220 [Spiroplasma sp. SV19]
MSLKKYYHWIYISKNDVKTFNSAFTKTPNLYCNDEKAGVKCSAKTEIDDIKNHDHCYAWTIKDTNIKLIHETNYGPYLIKVKWQKLDFNEEFKDFLIQLVFEAHELAQQIKDEGLYGEVQEGAVTATISSLVAKWSYSADYLTILDLTSELLFAFACRHKFKNGNKRTALIVGVLFLKFCGLFFMHTNVTEKDYMEYWEELMVSIVETFTIEKEKENKLLKRISKTIDKFITLSYTRYID